VKRGVRLLRKSGLSSDVKLNNLRAFRADPLGHSHPQQYPQSPGPLAEPLGTPLTIREVAAIIGCSPWTVRQRYLSEGLPHHRLSRTGKLIFYRNQVIRWVLARQQKGGSL